MGRRDDHASTGDPPSIATRTAGYTVSDRLAGPDWREHPRPYSRQYHRLSRDSNCDRSVSRRGFIAGATATASVALAGCGGRLPGDRTNVDTATRHDEDTLVWEYPASAVQDDEDIDGIGYASIQFRVVNPAWNTDRVAPGLPFTLNSTVGNLAIEERYQGYQADWFRFRIGVPRGYDGTLGAFVQPNQWPELRTTYGHEGATRELVVMAPDVNEDGTVTVGGRFRSSTATLPRQLHCGFEVQASRPGLLGRTVTADGRTTFDLSTLDIPRGITLE